MKTLIRFYVEKGCGYCDKYAPIWEAFKIAHPEIEYVEVGKETLKSPDGEMHAKYGVTSYPTTIALLGGEFLNKTTGVKQEQELLDMFKTLQNISDEELMATGLDLNIEIAKLQKQMFQLQSKIGRLNAEAERRKALTEPSFVPEAVPEKKPLPKTPIDLSGFPEGQSPEGGGCEGCGDIKQ